MQAGSACTFKQGFIRFFNRYPLLFLILLFWTQVVDAQPAAPTSRSFVLVLKLVSATHVKPTTGILLSDNGLVLVAADFVSKEAEIVVLDGGTDILSNGRPAKIVKQSISGGLALLSVEGLKRPGFILSENALNIESELHLAAFPPAEYIAKGAEPLWLPIKVLPDELNGWTTVSPETPLPYVTGPIVDACGYLAGLSLSSGAQSLEPGKIPVTIFNEELKHILDSIQLNLPRASCGKPVRQVEAVLSRQDHSSVAITTAGVQEQALEASEIETRTPAHDRAEIQGLAGKQSLSDSDQGAILKTSAPTSFWRSVPLWPVLVGITILTVLIWKGFFFFRPGKSEIKNTFRSPEASRDQPASDEPDTTQLQAASDATSGKPRSAPMTEAESPDLNALPQGCNGVVMLAGLLDADTHFKRFCAVNTEQINIVIGRGDADISIEHPVISRSHARLECDADFMTLSDLGSSNGTYIRDIPCLPGEVMFVETEDEIFLGDVRFHITVIRKEAEPS